MKPASIENFAGKARELVRLASYLNAPSKDNYEQFSRTSGSDSDNEQMPDPVITPPFTTTEWTVIVRKFKELQRLYNSAKKHSFENAHGKYFVEGLFNSPNKVNHL